MKTFRSSRRWRHEAGVIRPKGHPTGPSLVFSNWLARVKREIPYLVDPSQPIPRRKGSDDYDFTVVNRMMENIRRHLEEGNQDNNDQPPSNKVTFRGLR